MFCVRVIQQTNDAYKYYIKNKNNDHLFEDLQFLKTQLNISIRISKQTYYYHKPRKLLHHSTSPKTCCSILKSFLNDTVKIPFILPLFFKNIFISGFKRKAELFNFFSLSSFP